MQIVSYEAYMYVYTEARDKCYEPIKISLSLGMETEKRASVLTFK